MKVHVVHIPVMPVPGKYDCTQISQTEFYRAIKEAHDAGNIVSWIKYIENIRLIKQITGVKLERTRLEMTGIEPGDVLLCSKLHYRPDGTRGVPTLADNFDYYRITYTR